MGTSFALDEIERRTDVFPRERSNHFCTCAEVKAMRKIRRTHLPAFLFLVFVGSVQAGTITIDFDSVPIDGAGIGDGVSYLAGFGVTVTETHAVGTPAPRVAVFDDRFVYGGGVIQAPSPHALFSMDGNNGPLTMTLDFASPLDSFSFASVGQAPNGPPTSYPSWAAEALDANGAVLSSAFQGAGVNRPTASFSLTSVGPLIDRVVFYRDGTRGTSAQNFTAFSFVLLDDLVLSGPNVGVGEPSVLVLLCAALLALSIRGRSMRGRPASC